MENKEREYQRLDLFRLKSDFRGRSIFYIQLWWCVETFLFRASPLFMYGWRRFLLRIFGAKIGKSAMIRPSVRIIYPWRLQIGDYSWIGDDVVIYCLEDIVIGSHTVVSQKSYLCTGSHDYKAKEFTAITQPIVIEDEVWIAADVFVAPGVRIEKGVVVGARSSVFTNLERGKVYIGTPAQYHTTR